MRSDQLALPLTLRAAPVPDGLQPITVAQATELCRLYHGYKGAGNVATHAFGVFESSRLVAAYLWNPPPPGAAKAVCPEAPGGVLALSRMVAVPRAERALRHVSKPLRFQMRRLIDRTRWPVLVTYSDESQGHTGHVYKCSGWEKTARMRAQAQTTADGQRVSTYSGGASRRVEGSTVESIFIQRWEHWVCERGDALRRMAAGGWRLEPVPGKTWKSGNPAFTWVKTSA